MKAYVAAAVIGLTSCSADRPVVSEHPFQGLDLLTVSLPKKRVEIIDAVEQYVTFERQNRCLLLREGTETFTPVFVNGYERSFMARPISSITGQEWNVMGGPIADNAVQPSSTRCGTKYYAIKSARPASEVRGASPVSPQPPKL
jgi:hypothetical protein